MTLPLFRADDDPGPSFLEVLKRAGVEPRWADLPRELQPHEITHGTTVVAIRYADGVVMAGDRRATAGGFISHRPMGKVFPADRHSGVAIAGAAGPAVEMVKLFQLQLEHYEKVEGAELSLDGKANQLAGMVRSHLPAALQGFAVVPLFAGFDTKRGTGRLFEYDVTGGRYEESEFAATGSGSLHAGADLKGYSFSREDVDAQSLANAYAQMLGDVFTHEIKPMEVEIVVAEVGTDPDGDRLFHILYDGTVVDETGFTVLGGEADAIAARLKDTYQPGLALDAALRAAVAALAGPGRTLAPAELEVAVMARGNGRRAFQRLGDDATAAALSGGEVKVETPPEVTPPAEATPSEPPASGDGEDSQA